MPQIIATGDVFRAYSGGWTLPERQCAWTNVVFSGLVRGLFIVSHETEGTAEWRVHGGSVEIADARAARIEPLLPDRVPKRGGRWRDHRQVIDAIAWKVRTGSPWVHLLPENGLAAA